MRHVKRETDLSFMLSMLQERLKINLMSYLSLHLALLLFCFEFCLLYRIFCDAEIRMADLMTLKYLSCNLHGQPER